MPHLNDQKGFTLSEVMISLTTILIILALTIPLLHSVKGKSYYEEMAAQNLFTFIQDEVNRSRSITVQSNKVTITDIDRRKVVIESYGSVVRRSVDGRGYEVLIQEIQSLDLTIETNILLVEVMMEDNERFEKAIHLPVHE